MNLEHLSTALDADTRARIALTSQGMTAENILGVIRAENVLLDVAIGCGMPFSTLSARDWAAERVAKWLCEA